MARKRKDKDNDHDNDQNAQSIADASRNSAAAEVPAAEQSSGGGLGRLLFLLLIAAILAMVLSKDLRSKVLDLLFGAEEEFDYSSTMMPTTDSPVGATAS
jgi:hypothetical protein